jgi:ketosteroid isomerase-like protein
MSDYVAVLFANDAFYLAFNNRDMVAMDAAWSERSSITCIHPGWELLSGREHVIESWDAILSSGHSPSVLCSEASASVFGDIAYVVCCEELEGAYLMATNIFTREDAIWKLVHHQAGAAPPPEEEAEDDDNFYSPETIQ